MKYGCISIEKGSVNTAGERVINIGDYMQLMAVLNLYRIMGIREKDIVRIEYYDLFDYSGEEVVLPINFIWFNPFWGERNLILPEAIHPVFLGIHSIGDDYSNDEVEYLRQHEPIGCRDAYTYQVLKNRGVKAYLHGCLTATLPQRDLTSNGNRVYMVDVPYQLLPYIPDVIKEKAVKMSHQFYGSSWSDLSWESVAKKTLSKYKEDASLIITSRLHCASPCMALGIPVVFAHQKKASSFSWIGQLLTIYNQEIWENINWYPEKVEYEQLKEKIIYEDIQRIKDTANGIKQDEISGFFVLTSDLTTDFENGELMRIKQFAEEKWRNNDQVEYAIWGVTQMAEHAYKFLTDHFPNAKLVNVYDNYRKILFHGFNTKKIDSYNINDGVYLIATGNSTSIASCVLFEEKGWNKSYLCTCYEGLHHMMGEEIR